MAPVRLAAVTRRFDAVTAIEDISLTVPDGEFWVLVGPSGCGKSTVLRTIAGLEQATAGQIFIGERLVNGVPARERDVAMVFQNYALYPHMTVAQNLAFGLRMRGTDATTQQERVATVAQLLGLAHLLDRKPRQLSGGQQQRVALGRAIARQPQVFLLDEPLSNLDAQLRDDTRAELKRLHQQVGITTLYVTHDQVEAMTLADQIVVLDQGRIQQIGSPQTVYAKPANRMVARFLGNPPMNLLPVTVTAGQAHLGPHVLPLPDWLWQLGGLPAQLELGIRPEHLHWRPAQPHFAAVVEVVEPLGRETLVRATLPEMPEAPVLHGLLPAHATVKPGDRLPLAIDVQQLHVFDAQTGQRLLPRPAAN